MTRKRRQTAHSTEQMIQIIKDYVEETGQDEIDMNEVARWAIGQGRWRPLAYDPRKACAKELSRAVREEHYEDPQGRQVRKRHVYVIVDDDGQKRWHWVDITTARPEPMHKSLQARRKSALGDVSQLASDLASYNENNQYGAKLEMSFNFDADLAEISQPTEYPEEAPEDEDGVEDEE